METVHYGVNMGRLPIGAKFREVTGSWFGFIGERDGRKVVYQENSDGEPKEIAVLQEGLEFEKNRRLNIVVTYLPKLIPELEYVENNFYDWLNVMELPVGTKVYDWERQTHAEILIFGGEVSIWLKQSGDFLEDMKRGRVQTTSYYVMEKARIDELGEDLLALEKPSEDVPNDKEEEAE
ncbi:hypothetical protein [Bacillus cereus]|uniref:hypothetical protein n=1 Tax=Bacillus cereus TaxID=1396 RepID=UPI000BFDDCD7|nr:hypothetical protein [Bacillus cereus]PGR83591.1 hypothetical protein COC63_06290 [Bacillus cereus]